MQDTRRWIIDNVKDKKTGDGKQVVTGPLVELNEKVVVIPYTNYQDLVNRFSIAFHALELIANNGSMVGPGRRCADMASNALNRITVV
jgi:hypothetical protein